MTVPLLVTLEAAPTEVRSAPLSFVGFEHDRQPPAEWVEQLRALSPKSDELGWLELHWEAGDPWIPGQRWVLYEMQHERTVDDDIMDELRGPHPRTEGHMCTDKVPKQFQCLCQPKLQGWRGGECCLITLSEWKLFRRTGYYAKPFWILQGTRGGHKWHFNKYEEIMCRQANLPDHPPALGSLPFAPFDSRVVTQIMRHNRLMSMGKSIGEYKRIMGAGYARHKATIEQEMRRQYVAHLTEQMADTAELFIKAADQGEGDNERPTSIDWARVEEASTKHYIESGNVLDPSQVKGAFTPTPTIAVP